MNKYRLELESNLDIVALDALIRESMLHDYAKVTRIELQSTENDPEEELFNYLFGDNEYAITEKGEDLLHYAKGESAGYWNDDDYEDGKRKVGSLSDLINGYRIVSGEESVPDVFLAILKAILA